jgi:hypothetical protein
MQSRMPCDVEQIYRLYAQIFLVHKSWYIREVGIWTILPKKVTHSKVLYQLACVLLELLALFTAYLLWPVSTADEHVMKVTK